MGRVFSIFVRYFQCHMSLLNDLIKYLVVYAISSDTGRVRTASDSNSGYCMKMSVADVSVSIAASSIVIILVIDSVVVDLG